MEEGVSLQFTSCRLLSFLLDSECISVELLMRTCFLDFFGVSRHIIE